MGALSKTIREITGEPDLAEWVGEFPGIKGEHRLYFRGMTPNDQAYMDAKFPGWEDKASTIALVHLIVRKAETEGRERAFDSKDIEILAEWDAMKIIDISDTIFKRYARDTSETIEDKLGN